LRSTPPEDLFAVFLLAVRLAGFLEPEALLAVVVRFFAGAFLLERLALVARFEPAFLALRLAAFFELALRAEPDVVLDFFPAFLVAMILPFARLIDHRFTDLTCV
jgi:hypothetical protein